MLVVLLAAFPLAVGHGQRATSAGPVPVSAIRSLQYRGDAPSEPAGAPATRHVGNGLIAYADRLAGPIGPVLRGAQLFTVEPDGTSRRQLTDSAGANFLPAWSPDGEKIAFVSTRTGSSEIWVMDADGANPTQLTLGGGNMLPAWSPGGDSLACVSHSSGSPQIWVMKADGRSPRQLTHRGRNGVPTWSADGRRIAFWRGNSRGFGQIWVMNADGSDQRQLTTPRTDPYTPHGSSANAPAWLHSGKIAFWSGIEHRYGQIWVMDADGSNQRQLTESRAPISNDNPAWSPDGTKILFDTSRTGRPEIWVMKADGSDAQPVVPSIRALPGRASWQPIVGE